MNKQDLRVQKTQQALLDALFELLQTQSFEQMTVQTICDKALIRRSTFYRHYHDKFDLLNAAIESVVNHIREIHLPIIHPHHPKQFFEKFIRDILLFLKEKKMILHSLVSVNFNGEVSHIIYNQVYNAVKQQIEWDKKTGQFYIDTNIYNSFLAGGILSVIMKWIRQGQKVSIDKITTEIVTLIEGARNTHLKKLK